MKFRRGVRRALRRVRHFPGSDGAISALEYAMVVGIIAVAVGTAILVFADDYKAPITAVAGKVGAITTPAIQITP